MMSKKVIKYSSAGLIFVSLLLVFTISVSALPVPSDNAMPVIALWFEGYTDNGDRISFIKNTDGQGSNSDYITFMSKEVFDLPFYEYDIALLDYFTEHNLSTSSVTLDFKTYSYYNYNSFLIDQFWEYGVRVKFYFYITYENYNDVSQELYLEHVKAGQDDFDSYNVSLSYIGTVLGQQFNTALYECSYFIDPHEFDDGASYSNVQAKFVFNGDIPHSLIYGITSNFYWVLGNEYFAGENPIPDSTDTTEPTIPDRPGPEIIGDQQNKLDQMKDHFEQPAPDLNDAMQHIDPNQMQDISGFFKADSKFYVFMTALMVIGVSFGLIGYVLHGKRG